MTGMTPACDPIAASAARAEISVLPVDLLAGAPVLTGEIFGTGMDADRRVQVGIRSTEHRRFKSAGRDPGRVNTTRIDPPAGDHRPRHRRDRPGVPPVATLRTRVPKPLPAAGIGWPDRRHRHPDIRRQTRAPWRSGHTRSQPLVRRPSWCSHVAPPPTASPDPSGGSMGRTQRSDTCRDETSSGQTDTGSRQGPRRA